MDCTWKSLSKFYICFFALMVTACGGSNSSEKTLVAPLSVEDIEIVDQESAIVSGNTIKLSVQFNRQLNAPQQLGIEWVSVEEQSIIATQEVDLEEGIETKLIQLTTPEIDTAQYDTAHQLKIRVSLNESHASSSGFTLFVPPPADKLLNSNGNKWSNEQQSQRVWDEGVLQVVGTNFDLWPIPDNPSWREDPFDNNTWLLYYHSLGWLYALDYEYETSGDVAVLQRIEFLIMDYLKDNPRAGENNYMAWNDHSVAWRLEALTYFYQKYFRAKWSAEGKKVQLYDVFEHADELQILLGDDRYFAHNHSMFHAMSLYNFSFVFPVENELQSYRGDAVERINELFDEMVNNETGVSVEQSTSYHFIAMELFIEANDLARTMTSEPLSGLDTNLGQMADFAAHFIYRNGLATAMGDTNYNRPIWWNRLERIIKDGDIQSDYVDFVLTEGKAGKSLEDNYIAESDGYVIQRPDYLITDDEVYTFTDFGKRLFSHGHHDAGNVIAAINGEQLLIDIGGPYLYNSPKREYYRSAYAHNTVVVNSQAHFTNDALLLSADCQGKLCYSLGKIEEVNYKHWRLVVTVKSDKGPRWTIVDLVRPNSSDLTGEGVAHDFKLIYHMAESTQVEGREDSTKCQRLTLASDKVFCLQVKANISQEVQYFVGVENEEYTQGWVQPAFGTRSPAPVLEFVSAGQKLNAVSELRSSQLAEEPLASLQAIDEDSLSYELDMGSHILFLADVASLNPSVTIMESQ
ncbi:hypothetical protein CWE21_10870 [Pseudidiomarina aquimaris]|uniref:Heparinase II/III-like C-terminal domain-containing protein n=1 Tax=Pseudidiomarina aquimaris TaxID=641841 RepID=A0A432XD22_9GAMM|nr:heparinase II/III family protein [Pseudidiomarina aquimaris]RUO46649.1 hypothetical protein CWE21_10870 [Pseudidiomarina aquimaris]